MKNINKILALLLSVFMATAVFASCGGDAGKNSGNNSGSESQSGSGSSQEEEIVTPVADDQLTYQGTHIYNKTETNSYLVQNGATNYKLVVPANISGAMTTARAEFLDLFKDATGITMTVVTDDKVANADSGRYISLGRTTLLEESGIVIDYDVLDNDGHRIVTKKDDIYICGGADEGTVFGVYTFMKLTFNYETYFYDYKEIETTNVKKLYNYDVTDVPDFKFRAHSSDSLTYNSKIGDYDEDMFAWRLGYYGKDANRGYYWMPVHEDADNIKGSPSSASTNIRRWFPEGMYKDVENHPDTYHPKWFSDNGGLQVCFSAHGDAEEYELMVQTAVYKIVKHLQYYTPDKYPRYKVISMTHADNRNYCTCAKCKEISTYYGDSQAAVQILFVNEVAKRVEEILEANKTEKWYRDNFKILFFAYNHNFIAPAKYDAVSKKYVPIDENIRVRDNVIAWFAREGNGQRAITDPKNASLVTELDKWAAVAPHIYYWDYGTNFRNYMVPTDTWEYATPEMYAYYCNYSNDFWFTQYQDNNQCSNTAWHNMKNYVTAKLTWNTSLDMETLIDNYMKAMYKDGAPIMKKLFYAERSYIRNVLIGQYGIESGGDGGVESLLAEYWPIGTLEGWLDQIDQAEAAVKQRYEERNPELCDTLLKHIEIEAISFMYIMVETQGFTISTERRAELVDRMKYDVNWIGLDNMIIRSKTPFTTWLNNLVIA